MSSGQTPRQEVEQWSTEYLDAFIAIGAGRADPSDVLRYWGVPLHASGPTYSKWLMSRDEVVGVLTDVQATLRQLGYTHTEAIDKTITVYSVNASRVDTIMSRRRGDGHEVDRTAVSFELRRGEGGWIVVSTTALPTGATTL